MDFDAQSKYKRHQWLLIEGYGWGRVCDVSIGLADPESYPECGATGFLYYIHFEDFRTLRFAEESMKVLKCKKRIKRR